MAHYIGIDSADGAGKDFQTEWLHQAFYAAKLECLVVNEPKSTPDGRTLYDMITTGAHNRWSAFAEACLWSAARNKANIEFVQPALARGDWVITHRTPLTTLAYQGYGRGADIELLRAMQYAAVEKWPDFFIILDVDPEVGMARKTSQKGQESLDRFEAEGVSLQKKVRQAFLEEIKFLKTPHVVIDANQSKSEVHQAILACVNQHYNLGLKPLL
jgi:dTMP kinase